MEDATRQLLSYRRLFVGVDLMARQWRKLLDRTSDERVGVLLPNVTATPVVLLSLWAADKVPAILNFSTGTATMLACTELAGLRTIITSKGFLERFKLNIDPFNKNGIQFVYLEDLRARTPGLRKLAAL